MGVEDTPDRDTSSSGGDPFGFGSLEKFADKIGETEGSETERSFNMGILDEEFCKAFDISKDDVSQGADVVKGIVVAKLKDGLTPRMVFALGGSRHDLRGAAEKLGISDEEFGECLLEGASPFSLQYLDDEEIIKEYGLTRDRLKEQALRAVSNNIIELIAFNEKVLEHFDITDVDLAVAVSDFFKRDGERRVELAEIESAIEGSKGNFMGYIRGFHIIDSWSDYVEAFNKVINPLISEENRELEGLGFDRALQLVDQYGLDDYKIKCLTSRYSPRKINELMMIQSNIPTLSHGNRLQNRVDALVLEHEVIGSHSFIHQEEPGLHEYLQTMVDYYDACKAGDDELQEEIRGKLARLDNEHRFSAYERAVCFDKELGREGTAKEVIEKYEQVAKTVSDKGAETREGETYIDVLRRLCKNTEPEFQSLDPPETPFEELNNAIKSINPILNERTGEVRVEMRDLGESFRVINRILEENQGKLGIMPSMITAVMYLDKMASFAIKGIDRKELPELAFDPTFKEMVRFSQLTSSSEYKKEAFESYYDGFRKQVADAVYNDDGLGAREAYSSLSNYIYRGLNDLAKQYSKRKFTKKYVASLWSGNLVHYLCGISDRLSG